MAIDPKKIIVALDYADKESAVSMADKLRDTGVAFKIGMELYYACGPEIIADLSAFGRIFLDLKLHDISETMAKTARVLCQKGVWMFNVHAAAGSEALKKVVAAVADETRRLDCVRPLVIAVTVLTSLNDLAHIGVTETVGKSVERLAMLACASGIDGVVCSAREAAHIKKMNGDSFLCVTPGIRLPEDDAGDQKRTCTPKEAIYAGSDYLVIGRPITRAKDPVKALEAIASSF